MGGNYSRDVFKQLSEQTLLAEKQKEEICELRADNRILRAENKTLREKVSGLETTMTERIETAVEEAVARATAPLVGELTRAHVEIGRLKAIINKDSSNSSKPPSQNGFKNIPNSREKSSRPRGGQRGHPGHRLALPENIDELIKKGIVQSRTIDHTNGNSEYVSRYILDVEMVATITEHRYAKDARLPEGLYNEVSYGDNIKAMTVLLLKEGIVAEKRLAEIISGLTYGVVALSPATMESFQSQFSERLEEAGELEAIKEDLLNGEIIHTDDSPVRSTETIKYADDERPETVQAERKTFKVTLRTHSNNRSTFFTANPKKDKEGIERDGILSRFMGTLIHDHESKFCNYGTRHGTRGQHLLRELKGLRDLENIPWADSMRKHIAEMNEYKNNDLIGDKKACNPNMLKIFEDTYDLLIERGRVEHGAMKENELGYSGFNAMLNRLTDYKDCYLLFIRDYKVPFTNNLAERDLRAEKIKQKVSIQFRSWQSINRHTQIRSFLATVKKRRNDLFSAITDVFRGVPVLRQQN